MGDEINMTDGQLMDFVIELFTKGDSRYEIQDANFIAYFIRQNAILIQKEPFPTMPSPTEEELSNIEGPQEKTKFFAIKILENYKANLIGFERWIAGGKADVLGEKEGKTFAIECGPCRISKALDYLRKENTELWLVDGPYSNSESTFHRVIRGPNWNDVIKEYDDWWNKELDKVRSVVDGWRKK